MKKVLAFVLAMVILLSALPMGMVTVSAAENMVPEGYTAVRTVLDLYKVRYNLADNYILMNDIDLTEATAVGGDYDYNGNGWNPIGSNDVYSNEAFTGVFDGNGFTIKGLRICVDDYDNNNIFLGLFANNAGTIKNLHTQGEILQGACGNVRVGGVAAVNSGHIVNCSNKIEIRVEHWYESKGLSAGGIVGTNLGSVEECYNAGNIETVAYKTTSYIGGISGYGEAGNINNCYNSGAINSTQAYTTSSYMYTYAVYAGGIQGYSYYRKSSVSNCYNIGSVIATNSHRSSTSHKNAITYNVTYDNSTDHAKVENCYFLMGIGDACVGAVQLSAILLQEQVALNGFDFENVWSMGGDPDYPYPELQCFVLSGKLDIKGDVSYLSTVEPDFAEINKVDDTFTYEWLINDIVVTTSKTYTLQIADIGKMLKLKVTGYKKYNQGTLYSNEFTISKAPQTANAVLSELLSVDDSQFELTTVPEQEYSIDNVHWQSGGIFRNLDPNKEYTIYSRILENDLYLLGDSQAVLTITTDRRPLIGSVTIVGTTAFGDTLTANVSAVGPDTKATYRYEWKRGNEVVGTGRTYTIVKEDIDKNITLSVIGTNDYIGTLTSAAVTATKASVKTPNAPVVENKTNNTIQLVEKPGYEYSKDKTNWQSSPLFEGLSPNTEYTFYQRVAETETEFVSKSSNGTKATTLKNTISAPAKPVVKDVTSNSITLEKISGYEYSLDGITWQTSNVFTDLSPNVEYSFCQRIVETDTDYASAQSGYVTTVTLKNTVSAPSAPVVESATDISVTLVAIYGYEYSKNGTTWQKSNTFTGLEPLEIYTFYQRVAETETAYASEKSAGASFKVKFIASKPAAPVLAEVTNDKIVVETKTGYQYSIDGSNWRKQGTFTGLNPNTTYAVYCCVPESDDYYASAISNPLNVTTRKNTVNTPGAPIVSGKTDVSVTLVATAGYEYSKNGTDWQISNVFNQLAPNTKYTFYQRVAETETDYASGKSVGTVVVTYKKCEINPQYHVYTNNCDTSCNVCNATRTITHTYSNNCDNSCNVCGKTRTVGSHKYTNNCDTTCDYCNAKRTTKHTYSNACDATCNVCNAVRSIAHAYKTTTQKATLSKNGSIVKKCTVCGKIASNTTIKYAKTVKLATTSYTYNGKAKKPAVTVKDSAGKTISSKYYTVSYASGRKNVGTYKVKVKMKGNYTGTKTLTFTIKPTSKTSANLLVGATTSIGAKSNKSISYRSSNKKVATVSSKGVITAVKAGTATITVKSNGVSQKIKLAVETPSVTISSPAKSMYIGAALTLSATTNPVDAKVTWSVNDTKLAKISSSGKLTAKKAGTVTVTAQMTYKGKTYKSTYKVKINVEYPDVSVLIFTKTKYTDAYAFNITNKSGRSLKILSKGNVYCNGDSTDIESLYIGGTELYESITLKPNGSNVTVAATLEEKLLFLKSKRVWLELHVEYGGEEFILKCKTDYSLLESCYEITWLK